MPEVDTIYRQMGITQDTDPTPLQGRESWIHYILIVLLAAFILIPLCIFLNVRKKM